jgi:uncharacterized small protein (DUF1192 family)
MPLTGEAKRKYDREHKRKKRGTTKPDEGTTNVAPSRTELMGEIVALRDEVARLKKLLADKPMSAQTPRPLGPKEVYASPYSKAAQASLKVLPGKGPLYRRFGE